EVQHWENGHEFPSGGHIAWINGRPRRVLAKGMFPSQPAKAGDKLPYPLEGKFPGPANMKQKHSLHDTLLSHGFKHIGTDEINGSASGKHGVLTHHYENNDGIGHTFAVHVSKTSPKNVIGWHHYDHKDYKFTSSLNGYNKDNSSKESDRVTPSYVHGYLSNLKKSWTLLLMKKSKNGLVAHKMDTENIMPSWFYLRPAKTDKFKPAPGTAMNHAVKFKHPSKGHVMIVGPSHGAIHQHLDRTTYKNLPREEGHADKENNFYAKNWHRSVLRAAKSENVEKGRVIPISP